MAEKEIKGIQKFFEEFKAFAMRGNVLDMAVGVVVGSAFTAIVNSLVGDIISPLIGLFFNADFSDVVIQIGDVGIGIGSFLNAIINFLIVAFVLFVVLKAFNALFNKKKAEEEAPAEPTTKVCPYCQSEISIKAVRCPHCTSELPGWKVSRRSTIDLYVLAKQSARRLRWSCRALFWAMRRPCRPLLPAVSAREKGAGSFIFRVFRPYCTPVSSASL